VRLRSTGKVLATRASGEVGTWGVLGEEWWCTGGQKESRGSSKEILRSDDFFLGMGLFPERKVEILNEAYR